MGNNLECNVNVSLGLQQTDLLITSPRSAESQQVCDLGGTSGVLIKAEFQAHPKVFIELLVIVLLLSNFSSHSQTLRHQVFFKITRKISCCCSVSREMFQRRSPEATTPDTTFNHSGTSWSQLSMMRTRRAYSLTLLRFSLFSSK